VCVCVCVCDCGGGGAPCTGAACSSAATPFRVRDATNQFHGGEPYLRSRQLSSFSITSPRFMEPEGSLPCSQKLSIGPTDEPDKYSLYHAILYIYNIHSNIIHPPTSWSSSGLVPSDFPTNILHAIFSFPQSCYIPCRSHNP
jgi:hypothetical protein